ncbi:heparan-alpha-glucosaminide N-acetyltransferase domain-containing protein [Undibacterium sp. Jales W-56]|uniref:DUF1624 domain-containing protein n=1 Tax=Undibacterium sp. Jales W-56 TaxID=2897325 RepID=UPI0021D12EB0|nr:heparan-alpha-glucosaminide N-acetyltransferase domain-containing protein [Undibacterium sp. Jales W-56]MCU6435698.1 heparan-alpha-glucosaminide N-acetyltransferase domain-containing protein [Undibacterium sp. Jales W-56]
MKTESRVLAIDVLRGLVIALMALDHVRDFFTPTPFNPMDLTQTSAGWFFTRWITHLCAPTFVLLAGVSAFLRSRKFDRASMARYLLSRGAMLIVLELTWINFSWQFGLDHIMLQVIWVLGVGMMSLAGLIFLPRPLIVLIAAALLLPHNLLDPFHHPDPDLWMTLWHQGGWIAMGEHFGVFVLYPLMPWIGLMAAGYGIGPWFLQAPAERQRNLWIAAMGLMLMFVLLRSGNWYGDPEAWTMQEGGWMRSLMSFLKLQKYPPSLLYLCVTLSISLALLAFLDKRVKHEVPVLSLFGSHPLFFYCVHVALIHALSWVTMQTLYGAQVQFEAGKQIGPAAYQASLLVCYFAWFVILVLMYGITQRWAIWRRNPS